MYRVVTYNYVSAKYQIRQHINVRILYSSGEAMLASPLCVSSCTVEMRAVSLFCAVCVFSRAVPNRLALSHAHHVVVKKKKRTATVSANLAPVYWSCHLVLCARCSIANVYL